VFISVVNFGERLSQELHEGQSDLGILVGVQFRKVVVVVDVFVEFSDWDYVGISVAAEDFVNYLVMFVVVDAHQLAQHFQPFDSQFARF